MVTDQEIARGVESVLRESDPNAVTSLNGVVQQLEAKLGLDLSHKAGFIRDQISSLLGSQPQSHPPKDHFVLQHHPQFQNNPPQIPSQFSRHRSTQEALNFGNPLQQAQLQQPPAAKVEAFVQNAVPVAGETPRESAPAGTKRRGAGGLNKLCGVSPELQAIVGEPTMPRTQIVKQLWAYIRKNNLQDPSNKRKIICNNDLRLVFETDSTDMFKMNKLLAKHIIPLERKEVSSQAKRLKVDGVAADECSEDGPSPVIISEALAKFFGTGEREMHQPEALRRVWDYVKVKRLEDPHNSMVILCDEKLGELLGCESITAVGVPQMLIRHHFFKRS